MGRWRAEHTHIIRTDLITCPNCEAEQFADVTMTDGDPFPTFVHTCPNCDYTIMESEWDTVAEAQ